jgi:hypothetical protein
VDKLADVITGSMDAVTWMAIGLYRGARFVDIAHFG